MKKLKKRLISLLLVLVTVLGMLPTASLAASSEDEALGSINIYNGGAEFSYLAINGKVKSQQYTYYNYVSSTGEVKEIPAYCVNPTEYGVPQTVAVGESIEYIATEKTSDPKVMGIIANGYPCRSLSELGLENKYQAYYATKMALWCYLLSTWDISDLTVNPSLTGDELVRANKMLAAANDIYRRGTAWTEVLAPSITCTPDQEIAYDVTIDGKEYKQQVFTFWSKTWVCNYAVDVTFTDPDSVPEGTRIVDMENKDISTITTSSAGDGYSGQFKILYPAESVEGQTGSVQLSFSTDVYQYAVFYASCAEKDKYGNIQNYVVDTDPTTTKRLSTFSRYSDDPVPDPDPNPEPGPEPEPQEAGLRIIKYETGTTIPLEGAAFEVIDPNGATVGVFATDRNGEINIPLTVAGNYTVLEREAPQHYLISENPAQNVTVVMGETAEVVFENDPYGNLRVEKVSSNGENLPGAVITIQHIESGQTYSAKTNEAGCAMFSSLKPGGYRIQETTAPAGYILNNTVYTANINPGETSVISIVNEEKPGLRITKYDSKNMEVLTDITFEIFRDGVSIGKYKTNQLGEILLTDLQPGTYLVQEVASDSTHVVNSTPQQIELSGDDGILELIFLNDQKPGIHLVKLDSTSLQPLPNAAFRIEQIGGTFSKEYVTDENGEIDLTALEPGAYTVTEVEAPDGYLIDSAVRTIQINGNENARFVFTNTRKPSLRIIKTSSDGSLLAGVQFRIAKIEDGSHYLDRITGTNGEINITNLEPGVYSVKETATVSDHILDLREYHVGLFAGQTSTLTIENQKRPNLIVYKHDADTEEPVPDTVFLVKAADGHSVDEIKTDAQGKATLTDLLPGVYEISEKSVPAPYLMDAEPQLVTLYANRDHTVYFENHKKPTLTINKVDSITGNPIQGAKFEVWYGSNSTSTGELNSLGAFFSDANGQIVIDNLRDGWYKVTELESAAGFTIKEPATQEFYIKGGESKTITFENVPKNAIVVEKYDSVTGEALGGCTFQLRYLAGTSGTGGTVIGQKVTGSNGMAIWTGLQPGTYVLEEVDPANGYSIIQSSETIYLADNGEQSVITVRFENMPDGNLLIRKVCSVNPSITLQDAEFKITYADGTLIGDSNGIFRTDENGEILIQGLKPGKSVVVTETRAPDGFIIDTQPQTIQIQEGRTVSLTFKNQPKGQLIIQKRDSATNQPLSGAEFRVTTVAGCEVGLDGVIGSSTLTQNGIFTTDSNGEIRVSNLAPGAYVLTEVKAPAGYIMDAPSTNVVIGAGGDTQTVVITNTPKGGLIVEKYDSVTKQPLSGAQFKITNANGELTPDNEGLTSSNGLYTTDANGQIVLSKLLPGTYVVAEVKAPNHYQADPTPQTVVVNAADTQTLRFYNDPLCTLTILKRDAVTKQPLAKAEFTVRDSEGRAVGPNNGRYVTGTDGTVTVTGLSPNATIVVSESKAPTGYIKDETPKNIVVRSGVSNSLTFDNEPATTLIIHKYIAGTENEPLSGVAFKVVDGNGAAVGPDDGVYYTDKAGEIVLEGLEPGTTVIAREIKTVDGFVLDGTPQDILIKAGEVQQLTFWNKRAGGLIINKLDSVTKQPLAGVQFKIVYADGSNVDQDGGKTSTNGIYVTDSNGQINISGITGTVVVTEIETIPGYIIDPNSKSQTVVINPQDTQTLTFYNDPTQTLTIQKYVDGTTDPIQGVTFLITDSSGQVVGPNNGEYVTDEYGRIVLNDLTPGTTVTAREVKTLEGYVLDTTPKSILIKAGEAQTLRFYNKQQGTLVIRKLDSVTKEPLAGVEFELTYAEGGYVDDANGHLSSKGLYTTDANGEIRISGITGTIVVRETKTIDGYTIDPAARSQTVVVNSADTQTLTFYNDPIGGVEIIKVNEADKTERIPNTTFEIRKIDDELIDTVTTDKRGRAFLSLEDGAYYAVEIEAGEGFKVDSTPIYFEVENGKTVSLTVTNKAFSGILIHKIDANTREGIYGVTFLLYDANKNPVGQYTSDDQGFVYINDLPSSGRYYLRELENDGYIVDEQLKTVYVTAGTTTEITWENTAITGQIQVTKTSEDYNSMNGWPAGTPIPNTVFEIYNYKTGNLVDTIKTDKNGVAVSKPLPLGRYKIVESQAADFYGLDKTPIDVEIEFAGQIVKAAMTNKSLYTNVSIKKTGYTEVMPGQSIRYDFSNIANNSTTSLTSFYWRDTLPIQAVRLDKIVTGTYNVQGNYKVVFKTNLNGEYRTMYDNLSTMQNYVLDASPAALGLASNEYVTEFMVVFGVVPSNFRQVEAPRVYCNVLSTLTGGTQFVNQADVGGVYTGQWIMATTRWVTTVYKPSKPLPRTGY